VHGIKPAPKTAILRWHATRNSSRALTGPAISTVSARQWIRQRMEADMAMPTATFVGLRMIAAPSRPLGFMETS
jgi:hypothetical protein